MDTSSKDKTESKKETTKSKKAAKKTDSKNKEEKMEVDKKETKSKKVRKPLSGHTPPDIPWPPGKWRLGEPYQRNKFLFLRYATKGIAEFFFSAL